MNEHVLEWLPFYAAKTVNANERTLIEAHLMVCSECKAELDQWQALSEAVRVENTNRATALPPLADWITASDALPNSVNNGQIPKNKNFQLTNHRKGERKYMREGQSPLTPARLFRLPRTVALVTILVILVGLIAVGLLVIKPGDNSSSYATIQPAAVATPTSTLKKDPAIVSYPGAIKLSYNEDSLKAMVMADAHFTPEQMKAAVISVYATDDDYLKVSDYFKQKLSSLGYTIYSPSHGKDDKGQSTINSIKGDSAVFCGAFSYQSWQTPVSPPIDGLVKQLKPNQTMITYMSWTGKLEDMD